MKAKRKSAPGSRPARGPGRGRTPHAKRPHRPQPPRGAPGTRTRPRDERLLREDLVTAACLEAYGAVRHDGRLADRALEFVLRREGKLWSQERRAVAERVYALLRRQRLVDFMLEHGPEALEAPTSTERDRWRLAVSRVLDGEAVGAVAKSLAFQPGQAALLEQTLEGRRKVESLDPVARYAIEASVPDFLAKRLLELFGEHAHDEARAMNQRAPLTVRMNPLKATLESLTDALLDEGVVVRPTALSPFGLVLETRTNVYSLRAFKDGLFEVQDEGSQVLGMLVDAPPTKVVDACAGAGGKTLQLAAQMKNRGDLFALDVDGRRLEALRLRARRAGVHNCRVTELPEEGPEADAALEPWVGKADRVLVDAPCSGTGTFRRKPDARYRLTEEVLADHVARQKRLLERFSVMVKPGGRLIYGTCSFLREENEDVIDDFLARHEDFELADAAKWLGEAGAQATEGKFLRLTPARHGTDGFFGAVLVRKK